jgi:hypothetical protein
MMCRQDCLLSLSPSLSLCGKSNDEGKRRQIESDVLHHHACTSTAAPAAAPAWEEKERVQHAMLARTGTPRGAEHGPRRCSAVDADAQPAETGLAEHGQSLERSTCAC